MPKSSPAGKQWTYEMLGALHARRPLSRVLDIGAGLGTYSAFRQPGQHWTAIDIWGPYVETYKLHSRYDRVVVGDIRYLDWRHFLPLDLVICGDVIEHMSKEEGLEILRLGLAHARVVLTSIPIVVSEQGERYGNPFEAHVKSDWTHEECLASLPGICLAMAEPPIGAYLLSHSEADRLCLS